MVTSSHFSKYIYVCLEVGEVKFEMYFTKYDKSIGFNLRFLILNGN